MDGKVGDMADPMESGNPQGAGAAEGDTGSLLDGILGGAGDKGSAPLAKDPPSGGEPGKGDSAAPGQDAPLAKDQPPASVPPWKKQLKADLQGDKRLDKFDGTDPLARGYLELEGKLGQAIFFPGKDATREEWDAYYKKIGRPDSPDKYSTEGIEIPEGMGLNAAGTKDLMSIAHRAGLSNAQFRELYRQTIAKAQTFAEQSAQARKEAEGAAIKGLREEWGGQFTEKWEQSKRLVKAYGTPALAEKIQRAGLHADRDFLRLLGNVGYQMREDAFVGDKKPTAPSDDIDFPGLE